jgi:hypothetical protein
MGNVFLLVQGDYSDEWTGTAKIWTAVILFFFYFSTSEWCHCQPDPWMLVPAMAAWHRHCRLIRACWSGGETNCLVRLGFVEGLCWGLTFLIKPFSAIPMLCCWALAFLGAGGGHPGTRSRLALGAGGVLVGGMFISILAIGALGISGTWPFFLEANFGGWNQEYFHQSANWQQRLVSLYARLFPWGLVNLATLPLALTDTGRALGHPSWATAKENTTVTRGSFAAFYLGWFVQANVLQRQFDYHLVPTIMLGITLLARHIRTLPLPIIRWSVATAFLATAVAWHPLLDPGKLGLWTRCWHEGSTAELRDLLTIETTSTAPSWVALETVAQFLHKHEVRDGELTCFSLSTIPLYQQLDVKPSSRFIELSSNFLHFGSLQDRILAEVKAGKPRYVISDLKEIGLGPEEWTRVPLAIPARLSGTFPWSLPVVFHYGRYLVHQPAPLDEPTRRFEGLNIRPGAFHAAAEAGVSIAKQN